MHGDAIARLLPASSPPHTARSAAAVPSVANSGIGKQHPQPPTETSVPRRFVRVRVLSRAPAPRGRNGHGHDGERGGGGTKARARLSRHAHPERTTCCRVDRASQEGPQRDSRGCSAPPPPDLTVLTAGVENAPTRRRWTVQALARGGARAGAQGNTEVEERLDGGGRHDVWAHHGVRQLIPQRGPAMRPGPSLCKGRPHPGCPTGLMAASSRPTTSGSSPSPTEPFRATWSLDTSRPSTVSPAHRMYSGLSPRLAAESRAAGPAASRQ